MPVVTAAVAAAGLPLALGAGWGHHTVRAGDTLWDLARAHRTDVPTLVRVNHLPAGGHLLHLGQVLRVPGAPTSRPTTHRAGHHTSRPAARTATLRVRSGDTISALALRLHVSPGTLLRLNHLDARGRIYAGQHLSVPAPAATAAKKVATAAAAGRSTATVTVRSGDTLSAIAAHHGTSVATLLKLNHLSARSLLQVGQRVRVPVTVRFSATTFEGRTYPAAVLAAAAHDRRLLADRAVPGRAATAALVRRTAARYGVDPRLAVAVATQESGLNQRRVSIANAIGVMQVVPSSGRWAEDLVGRHLDLLSTQDNVTAGVVILRALLRSADTRAHAIAGYYQGLGSVRQHGMFADTERYVASVERLAGRA